MLMLESSNIVGLHVLVINEHVVCFQASSL
jgi:hypothetical protein